MKIGPSISALKESGKLNQRSVDGENGRIWYSMRKKVPTGEWYASIKVFLIIEPRQIIAWRLRDHRNQFRAMFRKEFGG